MKRYNNLFDKIVSDDIVILHKDKEYLRELFEEMKQYLDTLKLTFKDNYQIFKVEDRGISFVGYVIRHDYTLVRKILSVACVGKLLDQVERSTLQQKITNKKCVVIQVGLNIVMVSTY